MTFLFLRQKDGRTKMFERQGSLFQRPVKRKKVESDAYYTRLIHYIHFNPVHHGFVEDLSDWQHSSYQALLSEKQTRFNREETLNWFGSKQDFRDFHQQGISEKPALEMEFA
jgi:putative transposase